MKLFVFILMFFVQLCCSIRVFSQDSINLANEEISYDSNELIRFLRKPMIGSPRVVSKDSKFGIIDSNGRIIVPLIYDQIDQDFSYREELLLIETYISKNEIFYYYWEDGYESQELYDEMRRQELKKPNSRLNLETRFRKAPFFAARQGELWGVINTLNEVLVPFEYNSIEEIGQDIFMVKKNDNFSLLTPDNKTIIDSCDTIIKPYRLSHLPYGDDFAAYAMLLKDNKFGAINLFNQQIVLPKYDSLEYCYDLPEINWICAFDKRDMCLNCTEEQSKRNHPYQNIVKYKLDNKVGLLDMTSMQELTSNSFEFIGIYGRHNGQIVQLDDMYTFLTHENTRLYEGRYDSVSFLNRANFYKVRIEDRTGVLNNFGEPILNVEWQDVTSVMFNSTLYLFVVKRKEKFGVIDDQGRYSIRLKYDNISLQYDRETNREFLLLECKGKVEKVFTNDI